MLPVHARMVLELRQIHVEVASLFFCMSATTFATSLGPP